MLPARWVMSEEAAVASSSSTVASVVEGVAGGSVLSMVSTERLTLDLGGERLVLVQAILMDKCMHLWLGCPGASEMSNLSTAMMTKFEPMPLTTLLVSSEGGDGGGEEWGAAIAQKLAKRLNIQAFVSCVLPPTYEEVLCDIEMQLIKHFATKF